MTELAREYGEALYALAAEEKLEEEILGQLETLCDAFRAEPDFLRLLANLSIPKAERVGIIDTALRAQVLPYVLNFMKLLCERGIIGEFPGCAAAYKALYNAGHGIVAATVTTAAPLSAAQRTAILDKLRKMTGREVAMTEQVDAALLGGVLLEMDGRRYDNTVRSRLAGIRRAMAEGE